MGVVRVIRDENGNEVGIEKVEDAGVEKGRAFRYLKAAMACQDRFRDSHVAMLVLRCLVEHTDYKTGVSMPGYDTIMYESGTSNRTLVADILKRFYLLGIIKRKQKRMNNSTVYTLDLARMIELRKPRLTKFQAEVIDKMNELVLGGSKKLTQDVILAVNDDEYIYEVLNHRLGLIKEAIEEGRDYTKYSLTDWFYLPTVPYYRYTRSYYFKQMELEEPELATFDLTAAHKLCGYCHEKHLGGCSAADIAKVKKDKKKEAPKETNCDFDGEPGDNIDTDLMGENFEIEEA
jgi:hypothetical protein